MKEENEEEIWKNIKGYEDLYKISNKGLVKSFHSNKERILKQASDKDGYLRVGLFKDKKIKMCRVHRLVANAFIDNPNNYPVVNHKDEIKTNNHASNLEWCTVLYNTRYSLATPIDQYSKNGILINRWESIKQASRTLKIDERAITNCCKKKYNSKTYKGYIWRLKDDICDLEHLRNANSKKVYQYDVNENLLKIWNSQTEASTFLKKSSSSNINKCCTGNINTAYGFIWKFEA